MPDREIVFYSCNDQEEKLIHESKNDAIEWYLDGIDGYPSCQGIDVSKHIFPRKIKVYGYSRMEVDASSIIGCLDTVLEELDENFGDPDDGHSEPTEKMKQAEIEFAKVIASEYSPWMCEQVNEEEIDVKKWVEKNCPGWLNQIEWVD